VSTYPSIRSILTGVALTAAGTSCLPLSPAHAQDNPCQKLQQSYQQELGSADSLKAQAAKQAMQSGSNALSQFGIQLPSSGKTQEAIQKGALAATNPQMQNAIMIQLLSANTHLQEMIWRGCKPSSG
jgi:hypothetical protein